MLRARSLAATLASLAVFALAGCPGASGPQGTNGPTGPTGPTGAAGQNGKTGPTGQQGPTGATGASGTEGATGATGAVEVVGDGGLVAEDGGVVLVEGPMGPEGPTGPTGPAGTFTGSFTGAVDFTGASSVSFADAGVTFGGMDLFTASMQGTYPAVVGNSEAWGGGLAGFSCGAPTKIDFDVPTWTSSGYPGEANGAFGKTIYTRAGSFDLSQGSMAAWSVCANVCEGPVTFFLNNPGAATTIVLQGFADNGPSPIYVNGTKLVTDATANLSGTGQAVPIPAGPFSISFVGCSSDGATLGFWISTKFITQFGLTVDFDSTFHRNGK